jgi:hypothetical protein
MIVSSAGREGVQERTEHLLGRVGMRSRGNFCAARNTQLATGLTRAKHVAAGKMLTHGASANYRFGCFSACRVPLSHTPTLAAQLSEPRKKPATRNILQPRTSQADIL